MKKLVKTKIEYDNEQSYIFSWKPNYLIKNININTFETILEKQIPTKDLVEKLYYYLYAFEDLEEYMFCHKIKVYLDTI